MIETWVRPGREGAVRTRFEERRAIFEPLKTETRPYWKRIRKALSMKRLTISASDRRFAIIYEEVSKSIASLNRTLSEIASVPPPDTPPSITIPSPSSTRTATLAGNFRELYNPQKRKKRRTKPEDEERSEEDAEKATQAYKLMRLGSRNKDGSYCLQEMNGWKEKTLTHIAKNSSEKAQALSAMIDYLSGKEESVENGRATSRHSAKKMKGMKKVHINGKGYSVRTLKPDGIPSVKLKGQDLTETRIAYLTIGSQRVILDVFSNRGDYNRAVNANTW